MRVLDSARVPIQPRTIIRVGRRVALATLTATMAVTFGLHSGANAQDQVASSDRTHSLGVNLDFPDEGLVDAEQLCVALFSGTSPDLEKPPLLSRCIDPGAEAVTFEGLRPGDFSVLLLGLGLMSRDSATRGNSSRPTSRMTSTSMRSGLISTLVSRRNLPARPEASRSASLGVLPEPMQGPTKTAG